MTWREPSRAKTLREAQEAGEEYFVHPTPDRDAARIGVQRDARPEHGN